jgi:hypothetical protein
MRSDAEGFAVAQRQPTYSWHRNLNGVPSHELEVVTRYRPTSRKPCGATRLARQSTRRSIHKARPEGIQIEALIFLFVA